VKLLMVAFIILIAFIITATPAIMQSDPCTAASVLESFQAAALSSNLDNWMQRYQASQCSGEVQQGARVLAQGYGLLTGNSIDFGGGAAGLFPVRWKGSGNTVPNYQGGLNVYRGGYPISELFLAPVGQEGHLDGYHYFTWDGGEVVVRSEGNYYLTGVELPNAGLWDVITGCEGDVIIANVRWLHTQAWRGNVILNLLYVGRITADGRMCGATYDSFNGGVKLIDWLFVADE
jgi:hypothetical protein